MSYNSRRNLYMGIDIERGNPGSRRGAYYAVAVVDDDGKLVFKLTEASLARVIRLAWDYKPVVLALDNPFELAKSMRDLYRILSMFPMDVNIVQVNWDNNIMRSVRIIAREEGLTSSSKLNPIRTAYILAVLASKGYGTPIRKIEEKTTILITKSKSHGKGGWSQQRFQRRVRAGIYREATRIREILDKEGLEYDYTYRSSYGGLENATFIVYAPIDRVKQLIKPWSSGGISISIRPSYKVTLNVREMTNIADKFVIVGIDPGISTGLAILDLSGSILHVGTYKNADRGALLNTILEYGKPILLASDVNPPPDTVKALASKLGASLYYPKKDLTVSEKQAIIGRTGYKVSDSHQRDALAAAVKAFYHLKSKLDQIESSIKDIKLIMGDLDVERIKAEVIAGKTLADAIEAQLSEILEDSIESSNEVQDNRSTSSSNPDYSDDNSRWEEIERLRAERMILEEKIKKLVMELEEERSKIRSLKRNMKLEIEKDSEIKSLRYRIAQLESKIKEQRERIEYLEKIVDDLKDLIVDVYIGNYIIGYRVESLTLKSVERIPDWIEIIVVNNTGFVDDKAISVLKKKGIIAVLATGSNTVLHRTLEKSMIPVLDISDYNVIELEGLLLISSDVIDAAEEALRELEAARRRSIDIEKVIMEYRAERASRE